MKFLHMSGCVHRDLKPNKILIVSLEPQAGICAKLSGFEASRNWNRTQSKLMITMIGTPLFMAPEIMSCKPYDKSVDVYSFGLVMYYVITGKIGFMDDESFLYSIAYDAVVLSALYEHDLSFITEQDMFLASINYFIEELPELFEDGVISQLAYDKVIELSRSGGLFSNKIRTYSKQTKSCFQKLQKEE